MSIRHVMLALYRHPAELIPLQLTAVTHEDSLRQPPNTPNSLNWLLGHILSSRSRVLTWVGEAPVWTEDVRSRYRGGSAPITGDGPGVLPFAHLLADFEESQARLVRGLTNIDEAEFDQPSGFHDNTIAESLSYFYFHEAYHIGQMADVATALGYAAVWL